MSPRCGALSALPSGRSRPSRSFVSRPHRITRCGPCLGQLTIQLPALMGQDRSSQGVGMHVSIRHSSGVQVVVCKICRIGDCWALCRSEDIMLRSVVALGFALTSSIAFGAAAFGFKRKSPRRLPLVLRRTGCCASSNIMITPDFWAASTMSTSAPIEPGTAVSSTISCAAITTAVTITPTWRASDETTNCHTAA